MCLLYRQPGLAVFQRTFLCRAHARVECSWVRRASIGEANLIKAGLMKQSSIGKFFSAVPKPGGSAAGSAKSDADGVEKTSATEPSKKAGSSKVISPEKKRPLAVS